MLERFRIPLSWSELLKRTFNETLADDVLNLAAQQAYYFFFALFPALLALISIASFFPVENLTDEIQSMLGTRRAPGRPQDRRGADRQDRRGQRRRHPDHRVPLHDLELVERAGVAVQHAQRRLRHHRRPSVVEGPDHGDRPDPRARGVRAGVDDAGHRRPDAGREGRGRHPLGPAFEWTWKILQWPLVFVLVATAMALVYYFAPDAEQDWIWITPGSVVATTLWVVASLGFKVYLANFANYTETYGAIGGVMVLLLWFYVSGIALLIGAELNAEIEHASPHGKDVGEKVAGEKKKIGPAAARAYEERRANGQADVPMLPDDVNCDLDEPKPRPAAKALRASDLLIGTAVLLPAALRMGRAVRKKVDKKIDEERAA